MTSCDDLRKLGSELVLVRSGAVLLACRVNGHGVDARHVIRHRAGAPCVDGVKSGSAGGRPFAVTGGATPTADSVELETTSSLAGLDRVPYTRIARTSDIQHGLHRRVEGPEVAERSARVMKDTSTREGSPLIAMDVLRQAIAEVGGVAAIVDRGAEKAVRAAGLSHRSAYSLADLGQEA